MKYLVLGSNNMVGHVVALFLIEHGNDVLGYDDLPSPLFHSIGASLYDLRALKACIVKGSFDAVINCTTVINEFAEQDKAEAAFINAFIPHYLEKITVGTQTIVVHRSTDCIFSGKRGRYQLSDTPDADSFYARTKAIGEIINSKDITIRTSLVGPELNPSGAGLLNWFMGQTGQINGFTKAIWTGLSTVEFSKEIDSLVRMRAHGLFQCVPATSISKYDLLKLFAKAMCVDKQIIPVENRLVDKSLVQSIEDYQLKIPSYENMMTQMAEWITQHKNLYPHYFIQGEK